MGIRFFCPNGHKLNVKANLAGKIGVCPECGAKMRIPYQSRVEADGSPRRDAPNDETAASSSNSASAEPNRASSATADASAPTPEVAIGDLIRQASANPARREVVRYDDLNDLLKDREVVWYVRGQNGQEYGPATSATLKSWIKEERVGPDMLVWRQDWTAWETAADVFPILKRIFAESSDSGASESSKVDDELPSDLASEAEAEFSSSTEAFSTLAEAARRGNMDDDARAISRKNKASKTFGLILGLVGLIVVLLGALIYILVTR